MVKKFFQKPWLVIPAALLLTLLAAALVLTLVQPVPDANKLEQTGWSPIAASDVDPADSNGSAVLEPLRSIRADEAWLDNSGLKAVRTAGPVQPWSNTTTALNLTPFTSVATKQVVLVLYYLANGQVLYLAPNSELEVETLNDPAFSRQLDELRPTLEGQEGSHLVVDFQEQRFLGLLGPLPTGKG